ncbi:receptor-type guanylate cyclase gcy-17-like [Paramacrobiotus metropolitanus]|uniref:receptor-type guanylate cyclase gcy-17-like n=1 Tax=Paramacrobiotus metropolitanus TaxID=2943436 RepID=UPI0024460800|nr:receptor-type guanylate cyclase gcy-17-like [Paramacrobiotus metropolitanus]
MNFTLNILYEPLRLGQAPPELAENAVRLAAEWHYTKRKESDITIYLFSGGAEVSTEIPHFMRLWNTLWISTLSVTSQISDRIMNPTWIAVNDFSTSQCAHLYIDILTKYRWTTVYLITDPGDPSVFGAISGMLSKELARQPSIRYTARRISTKGAGVAYGNFESVLRDVAAVSRVVLFFGHAFFLRELLITAEWLGMTNGEYVYIALETMRNKPIIGDFNWHYNDDNDQIAFRAYQSLLLLQPKNIDTPPNMQLGMEFIRRSARDYNLTYNISDQNFPNLVSSYWAVVATASLINESLSRTDRTDFQNGRALARLFLNHTYDDQYGSLYVDSTGQRRTDFVVTYFTTLGIRTPLLVKIGTEDMLNEAINLTEWTNSRKAFPPPNEPQCGYLNNKCLSKNTNTSLWISLFTVLGISVVAGIFGVFYWRYKKLKDGEQLLHDPWWQVDIDDLKAANASSMFTAPTAQPYNGSISLGAETTMRFVSLKGKPAVCFPCGRGEPALNFKDIFKIYNLLKLFKKLRGIEHQNIGQFYGLSIARSGAGWCNVFVLFGCPSRGSLPQVCCSAIGRDFTFTSSFVMDFLEGLNYVHHSRLRYHGRLSTFNCWIDKHFTLKLMNIASDRICSQLESVDNVTDCFGPTHCSWEPLFWLVPELDEIDQSDSAVTSMQAVDIFSSGLILYDILTAGSLYRKMQDKFGISTVVDMEFAFDNPLIAAVDFMEIAELASVIHTCLSALPEDRPSIKQLRSQLRELSPLLAPEMNQYKLFDKIYRQLCLYSNQLELDVILRTKALQDARRRCDALVRQFLPKYNILVVLP